MNNLEVLIIPLIVFGVWILSTLVKANQADKNKDRPRRIPGRPVSRPQAPAGDKYHDAAGRRRDMPEGMESHPGQARNVQPPAVAQRRSAVPPRLPGQRRPVPVLATVIEEPPPPSTRQPGAARIAPQEQPIALPLSGPQPSAALPIMAMPTNPRPTSPVLQEVVRLLRSPKSAAAAIVMREILEPTAYRSRNSNIRGTGRRR